MSLVFLTTLPFFLLLGLGIAVSYTRQFADAQPAINAFVFWIALPAFLFDAVARTDPAAGIPVEFLLVAIGVTTGVTVASHGLARLVPAWRRTGAAPFSLAAGYGNVGYLGVPIVIALAGGGSNAALAAGLGQLIHNLLFMIGYPVVRTIAGHRSGPGSGGLPLWPIVKRAFLANPVALSVAAGLLVALTRVPIPGFVADTVSMLGQAAVPAAMFAVGLTLRPAVAGIREGGVAVSAIVGATAVKMLVLPAVTLLVVQVWQDRLPAPWGPALVLMAAMPVSTTAFILAEQYDRDGRFVAVTVVATSAAAVVLIPLFASAAGV